MLLSRLSAKRYLLLVPFLLTLSQLAVVVNPTLTDPNLQVTTVITGLSQPTGIAFLGPNDFFVIEKASGRVKRVVNGAVAAVVLALPVNSNSERGLLGMALQIATGATIAS